MADETMIAPTTTAATPEELATITVRYRLPRSEAQAVMLDERARQVSWDDVFAERDAQRAEIERLTAALKKIDAVRNSIVAFQKVNFSEHVYPLVSALDEAGFEGMGYPAAVKYYGSMMDRTNAAEARATTAEADISAAHQALTDARIPVMDGDMRVLGLDERVRMLVEERDGMADTIPSLIAVVGKLTGAPMDDPAGYGLDDCVTLLEEHEDAIAGIGWQIGLTGETERADQAETRAAAARSDASRHERLWRAAMRGLATYRVLLAASRERERAMREVLTLFTKARYLIANRGPANTWSLDRLHEAWVKACDCLPPAPQEERQ